ncbi:MAG TPA: class III signal peptide-containing protein [archaeon]|mgnify:CR=1 FL=1|jgi:uncharacterized protein (UPF0333 family)|nr:class III signal peptide-containing protein [archaeon]
MKFNKKGQGALEYLLLIGGAVLIAVIVIALLVGMGSQNSENSKTRNEEAINATNVPTPSVVNSVVCTGGVHAVNWTAVHKAGNAYTLVVNNADMNATVGGVVTAINSATNPIISQGPCVAGDQVAIKTTNNGISVLSATVITDN